MTDEPVHVPECRWEQTTENECEYRATHHYCPHPEHACSCPEWPKEEREQSAERFARVKDTAARDTRTVSASDIHFLIGMVEDNAADANHNDEERERFRKMSVALSRYLHDAVQALRKIRDRDYHVGPHDQRHEVCEKIALEALMSAPESTP